MRTIYKYKLKIQDQYQLDIKGMREFLKVAEQDGELYLWCLVETEDEENYIADVYIQGTGNKITNSSFNKSTYFDSVVMSNGLVWHVALE
jgi:hypothetical protein